jgi:hypothetical protein
MKASALWGIVSADDFFTDVVIMEIMYGFDYRDCPKPR